MKNIVLFTLLSLFCINLSAQDADKVKLYHPEANAEQDLEEAIQSAKESNKHIFVQGGGNWCGWCIRFHQFIEEDEELKSTFEKNFVTVKLNYSPENKNEAIYKKFGNPERFGFPVFIILDHLGNQIHTQDSALLEEGKGYNKLKVLSFLKNWSYAAINQ